MTRLLCLGLMLCYAMSSVADDGTPKASVVGVDVAIDDQGRVLAIDEATRAALIENLRASYAALGVDAQTGHEKVHADGARSVRLGLDRDMFTVAREAADGGLELSCVQGEEKAAEILATDTGR